MPTEPHGLSPSSCRSGWDELVPSCYSSQHLHSIKVLPQPLSLHLPSASWHFLSTYSFLLKVVNKVWRGRYSVKTSFCYYLVFSLLNFVWQMHRGIRQDFGKTLSVAGRVCTFIRIREWPVDVVRPGFQDVRISKSQISNGYHQVAPDRSLHSSAKHHNHFTGTTWCATFIGTLWSGVWLHSCYGQFLEVVCICPSSVTRAWHD